MRKKYCPKAKKKKGSRRKQSAFSDLYLEVVFVSPGFLVNFFDLGYFLALAYGYTRNMKYQCQ